MALDKDTAQKMLELSNEIDRLWNYLGYDQKAKEARERARDIEGKVADYRKEVEGLFRQQFEESARYVNTISAAGYAGYFATWSLMRNDIDQWHSSLIGLLGLFSLALFIVWEIFTLFLRMRNLSELSSFFRNMISVDDFQPLREEQLSKEARRLMILRPLWAVVFVFSASTALIGALDLMYQLCKNL